MSQLSHKGPICPRAHVKLAVPPRQFDYLLLHSIMLLLSLLSLQYPGLRSKLFPPGQSACIGHLEHSNIGLEILGISKE